MILKALGSMCKKEKAFCLYDRVSDTGEVHEQWLGTSSAVFPVYNLPYLTEDNLIRMFDITAKQRESIYIRHGKLPETLNFSDTDEGELQAERENIAIGYGGRINYPITTSGGLEFINAAFLTPLADVAHHVEFYERRTPSGSLYFAVKVGFMIAGVIMPLNIINEAFVGYFKTLTTKIEDALESKKKREADNASRQIEQLQMQISGEDKTDDKKTDI